MTSEFAVIKGFSSCSFWFIVALCFVFMFYYFDATVFQNEPDFVYLI